MKIKPLFKTLLIGIFLLLLAAVYAGLALLDIYTDTTVFSLLYVSGFGMAFGSFADIFLIESYSVLRKRKLTESTAKRMFLFLIGVGAVILIIGFYFLFIKAGLPYQDPTEEMQKRWLLYKNIGEKLMICGFVSLSSGIIGRILCFITKVKENNRM